MQESHFKIDEDKSYYFLCQVGDKYHTLFVGWLREDLIKAFAELDPDEGFAYIKINVGEQLFINYIDRPLFLLNFENDAAFEFAADVSELVLFPSGKVPPDLDLPLAIKFPSYWTKGVGPMLDLKLGERLYQQVNGVWIPVEIGSGSEERGSVLWPYT